MNTYYEDKATFFKAHGEYRIADHEMRHDIYFKSYIFDDGAEWHECCGPSYETVETEVRGVKVKATVKLFRVEYWTNNDPSKYSYERY